MSNSNKQPKLSKNFYKSEFLCKCGKCLYSMPDIDDDILVSEIFIGKLQAIRNDIEKVLKINSGARCPLHNESVGGAVTSAHLVTMLKPCEAADISVKGWSGAAKYKLLRSALKHNIWGIGIAKDFIHLDSKKSRKAIWSY